jgi:hypothetical protein
MLAGGGIGERRSGGSGIAGGRKGEEKNQAWELP